MSSKMPPVPPANVSPKGPAATDRPEDDGAAQAAGVQAPLAGKVGQTANTKVNTTNQGLQQDR
jgi:hypothetical protein